MSHESHNWSRTRADVIGLLRAHDVTPTQQRVEIGQLLFERAQHFSADQVLESLNADGANVSKATVYNTLGLFAEKGLIREVVVDPNRLFYDSNLEPHHHFFHVDSGTLKDVSTQDISIERLPQLPEGTSIEGVDVIIRVKGDMP
jgi:Fur family iron response transcriptional regulator